MDDVPTSFGHISGISQNKNWNGLDGNSDESIQGDSDEKSYAQIKSPHSLSPLLERILKTKSGVETANPDLAAAGTIDAGRQTSTGSVTTSSEDNDAEDLQFTEIWKDPDKHEQSFYTGERRSIISRKLADAKC